MAANGASSDNANPSKTSSEASSGAVAEIFFRVANLTFGSANVTCALIRREVVEQRPWMTPGQYALTFSIARVAPGTNLLAFCMGIGWMLQGWSGALAALFAAGGGASIITVLITNLFLLAEGFPAGRAAVSAATASVVGIILGSAWLILRPDFVPGRRMRDLLILSAAFLVYLLSGVSPVWIVFAAAAIGYFWPQGGAK
jgi:chromate transporter